MADEPRVLDFTKGLTSEGALAGLIVHPGQQGPVVILVVRGGPTVSIQLDPENGRYLRQQLDTVLREFEY
jgi:hypothetical protein